MPKVSVCMPVYNGENYIAESIRSVLDQTYQDFELIISDNCSTDNTPKIIKSFNDSRIKYIKNSENIGLVANFNQTIDLANGQYICVWAHDDIMFADNLSSKVPILDKNENVGFVHSDVQIIDADSNIFPKRLFSEARQDYIEPGIEFFRRYIMKMPIGASIFIGAVLARKKCYNCVGRFLPVLPNTGDSEMFMRMSLFYDVACIGKPLVKYRLHDSMTSTSITDSFALSLKGIKEHHLACRIILNRYKNKIPQCPIISKQVRESFAVQTLKIGHSQYNKRNLKAGWDYLRSSVNFYPPILANGLFWRLLAKMILLAIYSTNRQKYAK